MKKQTKGKSSFYKIRYIFAKVFSVSPVWFLVCYLAFALNSASYAFLTIAMQQLFDKVNLISQNGFMNNVISAILTLLLVQLIIEITDAVSNFVAEAYDLKALGKLTHILNEKIGKLDPIAFEDSETLNAINKSYEGVKYAIRVMNIFMDVFLYYLPYFIVMGIYLYNLKPILIISILLVFIPVILSQILKVKVYIELEDNVASLRRKNDKYRSYLVEKKYVKDTRILGIHSYFIDLLKTSIELFNKEKWKADFKTTMIIFSSKMISLFGYFGILYLLFIALMNKEISVGAFAAVFASVDYMYTMMENLVVHRLGSYTMNIGKVKNYFKVLSLDERIGNDYISKEKRTIKVENMSFKYPNSQINALENISLTIESGKTIAIVGENGCGKSTLTKVLSGIYLPSKGDVYHNNQNTKEINLKSLLTKQSAVFQDFQKYHLSLSENIGISNRGELIDVMENIDLLNFDVSSLPEGLETVLSRKFGKTELSGGQWQKIAIARALNKESDFIVLDEPTSAIDPLQEISLFNTFKDITKLKTALIVTHRLGAVVYADKVIVMKDASILAYDTHEKLLLNCEYYANMWKVQSTDFKHEITS